ncbi:MAG: flagellar biosynthesis protein [Lachnospiraceae bacterium]|nr:flagellar biosynthesis protein [Lachnospiraceae bacterium]
MPEQVKKIQGQILEYWNKFNKKQKRMIISVTAVLLIAFGVLGWAVSRPNYETLIKCETASDAADVKNLLDSNEVKGYQMSEDGLTFYVNKKDYASTTLLLAQNNIPSSGYTYTNVLESSNGLLPPSDTQIEIQKQLAKQQAIQQVLEANDYIRSAIVNIDVPAEKLSILSQDEETTVGVTLVLKEELPAGAGQNLASVIAYMVGNETTNHIVIVDNRGQMIFSGSIEGDASVLGQVSDQVGVKAQIESTLSGKVKGLIVKLGVWDDVEVAANLDASFDESNQTRIVYDVGEGREEGYLEYYYLNQSENTSSSGGSPGTESNDEDTDYQLEDGTNGSSTRVEESRYLVNQTITETKGATGVVNLQNSSMALALTKYRVYNEEILKEQGELDEISFTEFQAQHGNPVMAEVPEELYENLVRATGIARDNIHIIAYEIPFFQESISDFDITTYLPLIVTLLIILLLAFVVWRSTRPEEVVETEPELSVEALLASTNTQQPVADIDMQDKSEARKAIEKFVDENPEAVALLLRNWLDDDWEA